MMWHPSESAAPIKVKGCSISKVQDNQARCHRAPSTTYRSEKHRALWEAWVQRLLTASCLAAT